MSLLSKPGRGRNLEPETQIDEEREIKYKTYEAWVDLGGCRIFTIVGCGNGVLIQIYLQALGTHPSVTRQGLTRSLCRWGMGQTGRDDVVATLQAAPLARAVYLRLSYLELGEIKVQVKGEEHRTFLCPIVWDPGEHVFWKRSERGQGYPLMAILFGR